MGFGRRVDHMPISAIDGQKKISLKDRRTSEDFRSVLNDIKSGQTKGSRTGKTAPNVSLT